MRYFVRTTLDRHLDNSYSQIEPELLIDRHHNNVKAFIEQIHSLAELNEDVVILEDDLVLCRNFKTRIEDVIVKNSRDVINFYYQPKYASLPAKVSIFIGLQCVYFPKDILKLISNNIDEIHLRYPQLPSDLLINTIFQRNRITFIAYKPCLVQHLCFNSLIHSENYMLRTPYFTDYLDDLNITMEEAKYHKKELLEYQEKGFKLYESNRIHSS